MSTVEKDPGQGLNAALAATLNGERVASGMTFDGLAAATGISKRTLLRQLSTMERHIDIADAENIAGQFGLSLPDALVMAVARMERAATREGDKGPKTA
jgi:hypothetical protein